MMLSFFRKGFQISSKFFFGDLSISQVQHDGIQTYYKNLPLSMAGVLAQLHQILKFFHISCNKLSLCELDKYDGRKYIFGKQLTDFAFPRTLSTTYSQSSIWHEQLEKYRTQGVDRHHGHHRDADGITEQQSKEKKVSRFGCYLMAGSHIPGECGRPCNENTLYPANDLAALQGIKDLQCDENSLYPRNRLRRLFTGIVLQAFLSGRAHLFYPRANSVHIWADLGVIYGIPVIPERAARVNILIQPSLYGYYADCVY
jgi:hypothetical protein